MFIRARYGHGGRLGYDREWRANPELSGGGELIDQGVHLVDLAYWFLGEFTKIEGHAATYFWDMPVDDNAFISLRTASGQTAWLHVSCTEWKNFFIRNLWTHRKTPNRRTWRQLWHGAAHCYSMRHKWARRKRKSGSILSRIIHGNLKWRNF